VHFATLIYELLLRLYPRDFRRHFGREIAQVFRTALQEQPEQPAAHRIFQVIRFYVDTFSGAVHERVFTSMSLTGVAWRELGRQRSFTITSVIALALGIWGLVTVAGIAW